MCARPDGPVTQLLSVLVSGTPRPKGSWNVGASGKLYPAQRQSAAWQECVALFAGRGYGRLLPWGGPAALSVVFTFERGTAPLDYPIGTNDGYDGDKLLRLVADALSAHGSRGSARCKPGCRKHAGVLGDDRQIADWSAKVRWGTPGAYIEVNAL